MITIHSNLTSTSQNAFTLENKSRFGEKKQGKVIYSIYETLYLIEIRKAIGKIKFKKKGLYPKSRIKIWSRF